ncbi:hypothetical protein M23134_04131 [Microscilla marina ATCC 23134]|uniref:Uncharacterized protein n=1 Tax=Microscilla marina ATCC 23134 TaxID=313606 RepID=A1ZDZ0_MICM2|nr:hypothetical protein M23134_04131 [Microscilla marina ATCC 23134]
MATCGLLLMTYRLPPLETGFLLYMGSLLLMACRFPNTTAPGYTSTENPHW